MKLGLENPKLTAVGARCTDHAPFLYPYQLALTLPNIGDRLVSMVSLRTERHGVLILKNGVFWDVTPCGSCKNRRFGGT
jgi:hypothetical protein